MADIEVYGLDSNGQPVAIPGPSKAPVDASGKEINSPKTVNPNDYPPTGGPTTPAIARGVVANTAVSKANDDLAHVCDFTLELQKNIALKQFLQAQANSIREAIRSVKRALGLSDATGQFSWVTENLQKIKQELNYIVNKITKPINDFKAIVTEYIAKIKQIVEWILSLPAKILKFLKTCLANLLNSIKNIFSDAVTSGVDTPDNVDIMSSLKELQVAIKDATTTVVSVTASAVAVVEAGVKEISSAVSPQELADVSEIPTSFEEITSQQRTIEQFANSLPSEEQLAEEVQAYQLNEAHV